MYNWPFGQPIMYTPVPPMFNPQGQDKEDILKQLKRYEKFLKREKKEEKKEEKKDHWTIKKNFNLIEMFLLLSLFSLPIAVVQRAIFTVLWTKLFTP